MDSKRSIWIMRSSLGPKEKFRQSQTLIYLNHLNCMILDRSLKEIKLVSVL